MVYPTSQYMFCMHCGYKTFDTCTPEGERAAQKVIVKMGEEHERG